MCASLCLQQNLAGKAWKQGAEWTAKRTSERHSSLSSFSSSDFNRHYHILAPLHWNVSSRTGQEGNADFLFPLGSAASRLAQCPASFPVCVPAGCVSPAVSAGLGDGSASKESPAARSHTQPPGEGPVQQNSAQLHLQGVFACVSSEWLLPTIESRLHRRELPDISAVSNNKPNHWSIAIVCQCVCRAQSKVLRKFE